MSKLIENNTFKKSKFLKYSLLASISVGSIIAVPFESAASSSNVGFDVIQRGEVNGLLSSQTFSKPKRSKSLRRSPSPGNTNLGRATSFNTQDSRRSNTLESTTNTDSTHNTMSVTPSVNLKKRAEINAETLPEPRPSRSQLPKITPSTRKANSGTKSSSAQSLSHENNYTTAPVLNTSLEPQNTTNVSGGKTLVTANNTLKSSNNTSIIAGYKENAKQKVNIITSTIEKTSDKKKKELLRDTRKKISNEKKIIDQQVKKAENTSNEIIQLEEKKKNLKSKITGVIDAPIIPKIKEIDIKLEKKKKELKLYTETAAKASTKINNLVDTSDVKTASSSKQMTIQAPKNFAPKYTSTPKKSKFFSLSGRNKKDVEKTQDTIQASQQEWLKKISEAYESGNTSLSTLTNNMITSANADKTLGKIKEQVTKLKKIKDKAQKLPVNDLAGKEKLHQEAERILVSIENDKLQIPLPPTLPPRNKPTNQNSENTEASNSPVAHTSSQKNTNATPGTSSANTGQNKENDDYLVPNSHPKAEYFQVTDNIDQPTNKAINIQRSEQSQISQTDLTRFAKSYAEHHLEPGHIAFGKQIMQELNQQESEKNVQPKTLSVDELYNAPPAKTDREHHEKEALHHIRQGLPTDESVTALKKSLNYLDDNQHKKIVDTAKDISDLTVRNHVLKILKQIQEPEIKLNKLACGTMYNTELEDAAKDRWEKSEAKLSLINDAIKQNKYEIRNLILEQRSKTKAPEESIEESFNKALIDLKRADEELKLDQVSDDSVSKEKEYINLRNNDPKLEKLTEETIKLSKKKEELEASSPKIEDKTSEEDTDKEFLEAVYSTPNSVDNVREAADSSKNLDEGFKPEQLKSSDSVRSISELVGSKEDLSEEFAQLHNSLDTNKDKCISLEDKGDSDLNGYEEDYHLDLSNRVHEVSTQTIDTQEDEAETQNINTLSHQLLPTNDSECGLLALSDGREDEDSGIDTQENEAETQNINTLSHQLLPTSDSECGLLALSESREDEDSGIDTVLEEVEQLSNSAVTETSVELPKEIEQVRRGILQSTPTTNAQHKIVNVVNSVLKLRLDPSIAVVAAGDEESHIQKGLWMRGIYGINNQGRVNNINGYRGINKGGTLGFDVEIENNIIGIAYSNVHSVFKFKNNKHNDKEIINSHVISIYGQKELPKNFVAQALVSASKNFIKNKTTYSLEDGNFKSNVKHRNHSYNAEALLNYNHFTQNNVIITPNIGLRYGKSRDGIYNEAGISVQKIALTMKENNILSGIIGTKVKIPLKDVLKLNNLGLICHGAIEHNFNEKTQRVNRVIQIQNNKIIQNDVIPKQPKTAYNLGTGIVGNIKNTTVSLEYNYYLNKHYQSHQGSIKLKVNL